MAKTELLPCPFCGGPASEQGMDFESKAIQYGCSGNKCGVHPIVTSWSGDMKEIVRRWNTRCPPKCDVPPTGWECSREKGHSGPCAARPTKELG